MRTATVMIHGRYQPFHLGHADVLAEALNTADRVCIGITNPDLESWVSHSGSTHRHLPASNPFTFLERLQMISSAVSEIDPTPGRAMVVPFPLDRPKSWPSYFPEGTVHLVPVFSEWEAAKVTKLRELGHDVTVMDRRGEDKLSASTIRRLILDSDESWEKLVPRTVAKLVREFHAAKPLQERIQASLREVTSPDKKW
ncbi:adenylyltransferase/cytidyltransferase family protein [Streptomyces albidoflavus]